MITKKFFIFVGAAALSMTSASAYDTALAQKLDAFYEKMTFEPLSKSALLLKPEAFAEAVKKDPTIVLIDIRTPQEQAFVKSGYVNTMEMPLEELFEAKNLDRIPGDKRLVVLCHSGTRAIPAALNLKMLGFKNVQVLENGIVGLAQISSPKTCILK
ncbi:Rhodanese domain protein [Sulfuricurvum kujiense DSM 16994]|uniref:Rhodanese domain protein n=1 Tax=Sulfuricurvum kujiense (strain ATCC BAA-921 / DSM 16994 / JCM 11577 / YK-1) TaxID=709032 RepID=E4U2J3_SULKY|nr:rhodanese-like domain-containing protein [Sulfuricurvum kujiense]ADR34680.1 Rhodanese domain protein [Sulfuricurvum kujiense DSM 16994]